MLPLWLDMLLVSYSAFYTFPITCNMHIVHVLIPSYIATGVSSAVPPTTQPQSLAPTESAATGEHDNTAIVYKLLQHYGIF